MAEKKSYMIPGAHMGGDPEFFSAWTLYDIGPAGRDNLATLMTVIANRGQPLLASVECFENQDLGTELFGEVFTGKQRVWCLKWIASGIGQMTEETLTVEANEQYMTIGLAETVNLPGRVLTAGSETNTFFIRHDSF
jgi:hypothetical protein